VLAVQRRRKSRLAKGASMRLKPVRAGVRWASLLGSRRADGRHPDSGSVAGA
jgi:hypothetical protein